MCDLPQDELKQTESRALRYCKKFFLGIIFSISRIRISMKKIFHLLVMPIGLLLSLSQLSFAADSTSFQNTLNQWRVQNQLTSAVVSIQDLDTHQVQNYVSGTRTQNGKTPVTPNTLYGVGSISKTFASATLLQLQEEGKLNLDDPIGPYFPQYPRWKNITIRQLLNMTSGIYNFTKSPQFSALEADSNQKKITPEQLINIAYQQPDYFAPGKGWFYSNTNYYLAGLIIEKVAGQSLEQVYQQRFFTPLGLKHTFYSESFYPENVEKHMAHAYPNGKGTEDAKTHFNAGFFGPAGGMVMSSQDLLTWVNDLFTPGKVLNQQSLDEFETTIAIPPSPPKPAGAGYGLGVYNLKLGSTPLGTIWWYTGVIDGYTSVFIYSPMESKIIVVQAASWPADNFAILFPNQTLMQKLLQLTTCHKTQDIRQNSF